MQTHANKTDKNSFHANGNQRKAGVPILISDKTDFKIKKVTRGFPVMAQQKESN